MATDPVVVTVGAPVVVVTMDEEADGAAVDEVDDDGGTVVAGDVPADVAEVDADPRRAEG